MDRSQLTPRRWNFQEEIERVINQRLKDRDYLEGNYHITIICDFEGTPFADDIMKINNLNTAKIVIRLDKPNVIHMDRRIWRESYLMNVISKIVPFAHTLYLASSQADLYELIPGERMDQLYPNHQAVAPDILNRLTDLLQMMTEKSKDEQYRPYKLGAYIDRKNQIIAQVINQLKELLPTANISWDLYLDQERSRRKVEADLLQNYQQVGSRKNREWLRDTCEKLYILQARLIEQLDRLPSVDKMADKIKDLEQGMELFIRAGDSQENIETYQELLAHEKMCLDALQALRGHLSIDLQRSLVYDDATTPLAQRIEQVTDNSNRLAKTALPLLLRDEYPDDGDTKGFARWIGNHTKKIFDENKGEFGELLFDDENGLGIPLDPLGPFFKRIEDLHKRSFCFLHTDLHRNNILIVDGDIKVIDWEHLLWGDPLYDKVRHQELMHYPPEQLYEFDRQYDQKIAPEFKAHWREDQPIYEMHELFKSAAVVDPIRIVNDMMEGVMSEEKFRIYAQKLNAARKFWGKEEILEQELKERMQRFAQKRLQREQLKQMRGEDTSNSFYLRPKGLERKERFDSQSLARKMINKATVNIDPLSIGPLLNGIKSRTREN